MRGTTFLRAMFIVLVAIAGAACGAAPSEPPAAADRSGPGRDELCERYIALLGETGGTTRSEDNTGITSPPQAEQHLEGMDDLLRFGRWARGAQEVKQAELGARIATQAAWVIEHLEGDESDAKAQQVTRPLYEATAELYYDCMREVYLEALRGDRPLTGACAEPEAPVLEGPNVIVYGSLDSFVDSTCELIEGTRAGDGCGMSSGSSADSGDGRAITSVEVAYDPDTCRALYETGHVRDD